MSFCIVHVTAHRAWRSASVLTIEKKLLSRCFLSVHRCIAAYLPGPVWQPCNLLATSQKGDTGKTSMDNNGSRLTLSTGPAALESRDCVWKPPNHDVALDHAPRDLMILTVPNTTVPMSRACGNHPSHLPLKMKDSGMTRCVSEASLNRSPSSFLQMEKLSLWYTTFPMRRAAQDHCRAPRMKSRQGAMVLDARKRARRAPTATRRQTMSMQTHGLLHLDKHQIQLVAVRKLRR